MSGIIRARIGEGLNWSGVGVWVGVVKGSEMAEVEIDYSYLNAQQLRDVAQALTEAADTLDPSATSSDRDLLEAVAYLETHQQHIGIQIKGFTVQVPAVRMRESFISLANALQGKKDSK